MKKCFKCGKKLPLFLFHTNNMKYQRPENKGKCFNCRFCRASEAFTGNYVSLINGKFTVLECKPNIISYIKLFFKK